MPTCIYGLHTCMHKQMVECIPIMVMPLHVHVHVHICSPIVWPCMRLYIILHDHSHQSCGWQFAYKNYENGKQTHILINTCTLKQNTHTHTHAVQHTQLAHTSHHSTSEEGSDNGSESLLSRWIPNLQLNLASFNLDSTSLEINT